MTEPETVIMPEAGPVDVALPDFEVKGCIGEGAFGRVLLALSKATGRYRAVKLVRRDHFESDHPYEVEFAGLKRFEEVSREHEGFVDILHVTRDDQAGYFAYVMELADDLDATRQFDAARYAPRTLANELSRRGRLSSSECVQVGLALTAALAELHRRNLVHRDVNPRNIIFVRGAPKLADVGLIAEAQAHPHTLVGTPAYMDPEVQGLPAGDLYAFGKLLYTMATGLHPRQWPEVPADWGRGPDGAVSRELEAIWRKACQGTRADRYGDAFAIRKELLALQAGASVLRLRRFERVLGWVRRYGLVLLVLLGFLGVARSLQVRTQRQAVELRQRKVGSFVANGEHALESVDPLSALSWFAEAWRLDPRRENDFIHRIRVGSILQQAPVLVQMWFHDRQVKEAFFAGQENQVLISDTDKRWRVYDLVSGKPLLAPFGMGLPGERASLSSRTAKAVTAAGTNRVWLWDYRTGDRLRELELPDAVRAQAAISPDGRWIATAEAVASSDETIRLWSTAPVDADPVMLGQHPQGTHALVFSPDSRLLLSAGYDRRARVWDVDAGNLVSTFTNHLSVIYSGAFSPDSRLAVTAGFDRSARVWDARSGGEIARFNHDDAVFAAGFSSDGTRLVTAGLDFKVCVWDWERKTRSRIIGHNSRALRAEFSPQNRFLLTSCFDDTVRVWYLPKPPSATPANGLLALGGLRTIARTNGGWTLGDRLGKTLGLLDLDDPRVTRFVLAPDDRHFIATTQADSGETSDTRAQLFDAQTARTLGPGFSLPAGCSNLVVGTGGRSVFAFNEEAGTIWDAVSGKVVGVLSNGCHRAAFSPDGKWLAVARANQVEVFDLDRGLARLAGWSHPAGSSVSSIEWDTAGRRIITACWNNTFTPLEAQAWIARTGEPAGRPLEHRDGVLYAAFSHDVQRVITCGEDFMAVLWDPVSGRRLAPPLRHLHQVFHAAFSGDDRLVATAAFDNRITVWSVDTGERLTDLDFPLALRDQMLSIQFTASSRAVILHNSLGQSYRWDLPFYERPIEDLLLHGQLLSGQQTDSTESMMPQSKEALRAIWERLRSRYPDDYSLAGD